MKWTQRVMTLDRSPGDAAKMQAMVEHTLSILVGGGRKEVHRNLLHRAQEHGREYITRTGKHKGLISRTLPNLHCGSEKRRLPTHFFPKEKEASH